MRIHTDLLYATSCLPRSHGGYRLSWRLRDSNITCSVHLLGISVRTSRNSTKAFRIPRNSPPDCCFTLRERKIHPYGCFFVFAEGKGFEPLRGYEPLLR